MKKILAVLLTLILAVSTGCFNREDKTEVAVFYYTYSDPYISSVRTALDGMLAEGGYDFTDYDANGNQTTQTEQVQTAIAKGADVLAVNVVDTGSDDAAQNIINLAKEKGLPVIFFNRSVEKNVVTSYEKCAFVGTDYEEAGRMQGDMIGDYLVGNYDRLDRNGDGRINYVMFKGQEGNLEAASRTTLSVENANARLAEVDLPPIEFYDQSNKSGYLVDQDGLWSSASATNYMSTILAKHSDAAGNMIELVIANNDEMALGAVSALQGAGYNKGDEANTIPVFGVDATPAAVDAIKSGTMTGSIKQDGEGMAEAIMILSDNLVNNKDVMDGISADNNEDGWKVNIPYSVYEPDEEEK